jgi:hypothetical protein
VDGDRLLDLLMDNEIGVTQRRVTIYELDEAIPLGEEDVEEPLHLVGRVVGA